jgi:hypothetical protein
VLLRIDFTAHQPAHGQHRWKVNAVRSDRRGGAERIMPADGTGAAAKTEFGTSGWQLGGEATSTARPAQNAFQAA